MNITFIHIIHDREGSDILLLHTDLPDGCWPYTGQAAVKMHVARGSGREYVHNNFPDIKHEYIDCCTGLVE